MPGIADPGNSIGRIDPSSLIGQSVPVEPRAVAQLTDAFRSGAITAEDIQDRVGELGQAKRKAEVAVAQRTAAEANDPALQAARRQALLAAGAQGQLATAQATAGLGLVTPQTDVAKTQLDLQQAQAKYGSGIQDFQQLAPLTTGYDGKNPSKPDGSPDFDLMGVEGNHLKSIYNQRLIGMERLKPVKTEDRPGPNGVAQRISYNAFGEDVSPDPNNRTYQMYNSMANQPLGFKFIKPGESTAPAAAPASAAPAPVSVEPIGTPGASVPQADAVGLDKQIQARLASMSGTAAPVVESKSAPDEASAPASAPYSPGSGVSVGVQDPAFAKGLREEMERNPVIQEVRKSLPQYGQLQQSERELADPKFVPDRIFDLRLAFNYFKSLHPETRVTEQNFKELEKFTKLYANDIPRTVQNGLNVMLRKQYMDPEARQGVIRETRAALQGQVDAARPIVDSYGKLAGTQKDAVVTQEWKDLLGTNMVKPTPGSNVPKAAGPPITLSNGQKVFRGEDGQYYPAQ